MEKSIAADKKLLKKLTAELKGLQTELVKINKLEGKDPYLAVKLKKNQARSEKIKQKGVVDKAVGSFYLEIDITAKQTDVFIPISIASGKKAAGFMYQIEGTAPGQIANARVKVRGDRVLQVTLGTLLYAKIPTGATASFQIQAAIRGKSGKSYKIVITRLNYKLHLTSVRYEQYLKELHSASVAFD